MAYDEALCERIRSLLTGAPGVEERRMFGGVAFLAHGNMAVGASGQGGLMVRVDPAETEALLSSTAAGPMVMRGRPLQGWVRVASTDVESAEALQDWVDRGVAFARSLPPKAGS